MTARRPVGGIPPETLAAIRVVFFQECETHLVALETGLGALKSGDSDLETLIEAYRAVHSIKGGAGIFELDALVRFSRQFETVLGEVRDGRLAPGLDVMPVLARASRLLTELVRAGREGRDPSPESLVASSEVLTALMPRTTEPSAFDALNFEPRPVTFQPLRPPGRSGEGGA